MAGERKNFLGISRLYQHGKTQIPSDVRHKMDLKDGDRLYYIEETDGRIFIAKAPALFPEKRGKY